MVAKFRSLLAVDAEGFSRNRDADLPVLHTEIRRAMECACERSGVKAGGGLPGFCRARAMGY